MYVWEVNKNVYHEINKIKIEQEPYGLLEFSQDNKYLVYLNRGGEKDGPSKCEVDIWKMRFGTYTKVQNIKSCGVHTGPNGESLVVFFDGRKNIQLWKMKWGKYIKYKEIKTQYKNVEKIEFSPDNNYLLTMEKQEDDDNSRENVITIWNNQL